MCPRMAGELTSGTALPRWASRGRMTNLLQKNAPTSDALQQHAFQGSGHEQRVMAGGRQDPSQQQQPLQLQRQQQQQLDWW
mmetsp:Transcript_15799/g.50258  ORF Transcript_15799/g.50258 Transcript_15799/m.50258 type:complete len:81 (-) Transcript_15799:183-425(-)